MSRGAAAIRPFLIGALAVLYALLGDGWPPRRAAIAFMMGSWGAHRAVHLLYGGVALSPERHRHSIARRTVAALFFSLPALFPVLNSTHEFSIVEFTAVGLWIVAFTGEATADRQRQRFNADPVNHGRRCDIGVWRYSVDPVSFFEGMLWTAYAAFASASPWGWIAFTCPAAQAFTSWHASCCD